MWVYRYFPSKVEDKPFAVGYYVMAESSNGNVISHFVRISEFATEDEARYEVNYLNGGNSEVQVSGVVYNKP